MFPHFSSFCGSPVFVLPGRYSRRLYVLSDGRDSIAFFEKGVGIFRPVRPFNLRHRGARITEKEFVDKYGVVGQERPTEKVECLTSVSTVEAIGKVSPKGHKRRDETVAVYTEVKVQVDQRSPPFCGE